MRVSRLGGRRTCRCNAVRSDARVGYSGMMPALVAFPAWWLALGGEAQPVDALGTAFAASLGVGGDVTDGLWIELRGAAEIDGFDRNSLRGEGTICKNCIPGGVGGPREFLDLRVGFVPFHGAVETRGGEGPVLSLGFFVGAGALVYDPFGYGISGTPVSVLARQVAPTTLLGGEVRVRWPGRVLGVEVYGEGADRSWIEVTKGTILELQHDAVFGLGVRLVVASRR
jgi:hypothetical protein